MAAFPEFVLEVVILLLGEVIPDRIAFDEVVLEDGVGPDSELCAALGLDSVADGDDDVEVVE